MPEPITRDSLASLNMPASAQEAMLALYERFQSGTSKISDWESIHSPDSTLLPSYESLPEQTGSGYTTRLALLKLNGGLGTSMGCSGPKSAIPVRGEKTFLDLIIEQLQAIESEVPLLLMNSFYTYEETTGHLSKCPTHVRVESFQQNRFPRLDKASHQPLSEMIHGRESWYPPGHGDLYHCLNESGLLDQLLDEGRYVLFISNADNLGAVADDRILNYIVDEDIPFLMEMTPKTPADVKGGTLYEKDGRLHLLEIANVPDEHLDSFRGMDKFKVFNTNNIWVNLRHLKQRMNEGPLDLGVIVNEKQVGGQSVIQLETAVGAGLENFERSVGLVVGRDRFMPVKTTNDLLLVQSDWFVEHEGKLMRNPETAHKPLPEIELGPYFQNLDEYQTRIPKIPHMNELDSLTIEGDVRFNGQVTLKGSIKLLGTAGPLVLPDGASISDSTLEG